MKLYLVIMICIFILCSCESKDEQNKKDTIIMEEYEEIVKNHSKMYKCNDTEFLYKLYLQGKSPNAISEKYYVVLTNDKNLSFQKADDCFWSSELNEDLEFCIVETGLLCD